MIIAEIGWNHMGDISLAKNMILEAKNSGCEYAKFQVWSVKNLKDGSWDGDGRREIYESAELTQNDLITLKNYCEEIDIKFLVSIFSIKDTDKIKPLNLKSIKIPSTEATNKSLIKWAFSQNFERVFISTGCCNREDLNFLRENIIPEITTVMHCVSAYPCPVENVNLPRINSLKKYFIDVGYSGHFDGINDAIAALTLGASYIEKHFTTDKSLPGRDNKFALSPSEMKTLCEFEKNLISMKTNCGLDYQSIEQDMHDNYIGRWDA